MNTRRTQRTDSPLRSSLQFNSRHRGTDQAARMSRFESAKQPTAGAVPILAPISAPILRSFDPIEIARFIKERQR